MNAVELFFLQNCLIAIGLGGILIAASIILIRRSKKKRESIKIILIRKLFLNQLVRLELYINGDPDRTSAREFGRIKTIDISPVLKSAIRIQFFNTKKKYDFSLREVTRKTISGATVNGLGDSVTIDIIENPPHGSPQNVVSGYG